LDTAESQVVHVTRVTLKRSAETAQKFWLIQAKNKRKGIEEKFAGKEDSVENHVV